MKVYFYKHKVTNAIYNECDSFGKFGKEYNITKVFKPIDHITEEDKEITIQVEGKDGDKNNMGQDAMKLKVDEIFKLVYKSVPYKIYKTKDTYQGNPIFKFEMRCPVCGGSLIKGHTYLTYPSSTEHTCEKCEYKFETMLRTDAYIIGFDNANKITALIDKGVEGEKVIYDNIRLKQWIERNKDA